MSHFSLLVEANDREEIKAKLLPYHEYESTGIKKYIEWVDFHDDNFDKYQTGSVECVYFRDERIGTKYSDSVKHMWKRDGIGISSRDEFILPHGYSLRDVPFTEIYTAFDDYMREWCGYGDDNLNDNGRWGHWTNPNAQWDWWKVGGRWSGFFDLLNSYSRGADVARVSDIDWPKMRQDRHDHEIDRYQRTHAVYQKYAGMPFYANQRAQAQVEWSRLIGRGVGFEKAYQTLEDYISKSALIPLNEVWDNKLPTNVRDIIRFNLPEEEFRRTIDDSLAWAFIDNNGEWQEKGDMGWRGMSSKDKRHNGYNQRFWAWVDSLPDDAMVWVIDCHI